MKCPEKLKLKLTELSKQKCNLNFEFWENEVAMSTVNVALIADLIRKSNLILPCHTLAYERIEDIFLRKKSSKVKFPEAKALLSLDLRNKREGKKSNLINAPYMKDSLKYGHEIFLFAYHNVHNPYHRQEDMTPIRPIGIFLKKEIEELTCVHGSPCDIADKNSSIDKYRSKDLDKFYLCPKEMRKLKPYQIYSDIYLKGDFDYYFGNPTSWKNEKGYGMKLFERAGEFRYLNYINPEHIEAILWPFWYDDSETIDKNLDLFSLFKKNYPDIKRIQYDVDKYNNNWQLAFVEASYYSQMYYIKHGSFEDHVNNAIIKLTK